MNGAVDFDEWAQAIRTPGITVEPTDEGVLVIFEEGVARAQISLPPLPPSRERALITIDTGDLTHLDVSRNAESVSFVVMRGRNLAGITIAGSIESLIVESQDDFDSVETYIQSEGIGALTLREGAYKLDRQPVKTLSARDCVVARPENAPQLATLEIVGAVTLTQSTWTATVLNIAAASELAAAPSGGLHAHKVIFPASDVSPVLQGSFQFGREDGRGPVVGPGRVTLEVPVAVEIKGRAEGLLFTGDGMVTVLAELVAGSFVGEDMTVHCRENGVLLDVQGDVKELVGRGSVVKGATSQPLRPRSIAGVKGSVLLNIDCFGLDENSLDEIESCAQFAPWVPSKSRNAVKQLRSMQLSQRDPVDVDEQGDLAEPDSHEVTENWRRARFWQRIARLSAESHASGNTQSQVRFVYAAARRYAAESRRERILLWIYSLIGYGERVLRPLILYALAAASVWLGLTYGPLSVDDGASFGDVFGLPLKFFRIVGEDSTDSVDGGLRWVLASLQLFGLLMLFFSLSAIRRVSKAE